MVGLGARGPPDLALHLLRFPCFVSLQFSFDNRSYSSESPLSMCPIHLLCLFLIVCIRDLSSPIMPALLRLFCPSFLFFFIFLSICLFFSTIPLQKLQVILYPLIS